MATTVHNFGVSNEKIEFSGSSNDDVGYAKTFWQSVQLMPPMESRLVSNDISQRLKAAPLGQPVSNKRIVQRGEDPPILKKLLERAQFEQSMEERRHYERLSHLRDEDRALLHKHRNQRKIVEQISDHAGLRAPSPEPEAPLDDPLLFREQDEDIREATLRDIERFEQSKDLRTDLDVDSD